MTDSAHPSSAEAVSAGAIPTIRLVSFDAPWAWLGAGWRDLWATPQISLAYGAIFAAIAYGLVFILFRSNALPLLLPLAGGFLLVGPFFAAGLYEVSRRREQGEAVTFADAVMAGFRAKGQIAFFGILLLILYLFWTRLASMLFLLFFGMGDLPPFEDFVPALLFTPHGLSMLVTGTIAGGVLAATAYAVSAISVPMLLDRKVDTVTAMIASVRAVLNNPAAMSLWAALILALIAAGFATLFLGLAITFPLIGHASWHAYRALAVEPSHSRD